MKIDEKKIKKFCIDNKLDKCSEEILKKFCIEVANGSMIVTTLEEDYSKISKLGTTKEKVKYLRNKGYTQAKTAEIIGISDRHVQRLERDIKVSK